MINYSTKGFWLAALAGTIVAAPAPASALDITIAYDPHDEEGIDPCLAPNTRVCPDGQPQTDRMVDMVRAAADHWEDIIEDDHGILVLVSWADPALGSMPEAEVIQTDAAGRSVFARVRIGTNQTYFYDPTPHDDEEFNMRPALYRTLAAPERSEAFSVQPPAALADTLELGCLGMPHDSQGVDLLTVALHELGHVVGFSAERDQCNASEPFYLPNTALSDASFTFNAYTSGRGSVDCNHLAQGSITACKSSSDQSAVSEEPSPFGGLTVQECTAHQAVMHASLYPGGARGRPSALDILGVAAAESWLQVDFPRKFSRRSGDWASASTWFGPRAPDGNDEALLANRTFTRVEVDRDRGARAATIARGNVLEVDDASLVLTRSLRTTHTGSGVGPIEILPPPPQPGSVVQSQPPATLRLRDGGVQAQDVLNLGRIEGNGVIGVTRRFSNSSVVAAEGGTLRITTPTAGGIVTQVPVVDLDGPLPHTYIARLLAREGNLEVDASTPHPFHGRIEVGPGRELRFTHHFSQAYTHDAARGMVVDNGTVVGHATLGGRLELEGQATLEGEVRLTGGARVQAEAAGPLPVTDMDLLFVDGDLELSGRYSLVLRGGYRPELGQVLSAVQASGTLTGSFLTLDLPDISGRGVAWNVVQTANQVLLSVIFDPSEVDADVNGDGHVNFFDYLAILFGTGSCPATPAVCPADLNGDGVVDFTDLEFWNMAT